MNCKSCGGKLKVKNSYRTPNGKTQRLECECCYCVHTAAVLLINSDPERGEGAAALAKRITNGETLDLVGPKG